MRGQDDRRPCRIDVAQELPHRTANLDVDTGRRLVEDQQARLVHESTRNHQPPFHPPGKTAGRVLATIPQAQLPQVLLGALPGEAAPEAVVARLVQDDVLHLFREVQVDLLGHQSDAGLGRLYVGVEVVAEYFHVASRLVDQRRNYADGRGLARAVRPEQRIEVALLDGEVDAFERFIAVGVGLAKVFDRQRFHEAGYCNQPARCPIPSAGPAWRRAAAPEAPLCTPPRAAVALPPASGRSACLAIPTAGRQREPVASG